MLKRAAKIRDTNFVTKDLDNGPPEDPTGHGRGEGPGQKLRDEVALLYGAGDLPAGNVRNLGLVLYSEHLLAIELAGTLLLVATIGAVAIAQRKGAAK